MQKKIVLAFLCVAQMTCLGMNSQKELEEQSEKEEAAEFRKGFYGALANLFKVYMESFEKNHSGENQAKVEEFQQQNSKLLVAFVRGHSQSSQAKL